MERLTLRERFLNVMEYRPVDRVPNWEVGVWGQTVDRWQAEGLDPYQIGWDWFTGEDAFGFDAREYIHANYGMLPPFEPEVLEETERYIVSRNAGGVLTRALKDGTAHGNRASMDQYLRFPVETPEDFHELKKRYVAEAGARYPACWRELMLPGWKQRRHVLVLGRNCSTLGFYWRAREWMGTENVSLAWYDQPDLMHEMMEFIADFTIEVSRPLLSATDVDYVFINEDMAMKSGPLLGPDTYRRFHPAAHETAGRIPEGPRDPVRHRRQRRQSRAAHPVAHGCRGRRSVAPGARFPGHGPGHVEKEIRANPEAVGSG